MAAKKEAVEITDINTAIEILPHLVKADEKLLFVGPPGTAKTTTAYGALEIACGKDNVHQVTCHEDMSAQELWGMPIPRVTGDKSIDLVEGPALRAWRTGGGLVLNEIDKAAGPVWTALYNICDDKKVARQTLITGEIVRPNPSFRVIATSNSPADVLPDALRDRFSIVVPFMELTQGQVDSLPVALAAVAKAAYKEAKYPDITFRKLQSFANILRGAKALSSEQQHKVLEWIFGPQAANVYQAIITATEESKKKKEAE